MDAEDKNYDEVFFKDSRNKRESLRGKKRCNVKDVKKRINQIEKRNLQAYNAPFIQDENAEWVEP